MPTYTQAEKLAMAERGRKGGNARARRYTAEERTVIAHKMLSARRIKRALEVNQSTLNAAN